MADSNLNESLTKFCSNMAQLDQMCSHFSNFYFELMEEPDNDGNVWNKLDANITFVYANTSLYWLYLLLKGTSLSEHPVKEEINRVRKYMQDYLILKKDAPKLNIKVAENFIRNALWDPTKTQTLKKCKEIDEVESKDIETKKKLKS